MTRALLGPLRRLALSEGTAIVAVAFLATLFAEWTTLRDPYRFPVDSTIHTYWMFRWEDPELFRGDPLTVTRTAPPAILALYRLGSFLISPVTISKLLPLAIVPLTVWLVFRIARTVAPWRPAAWIAALTYLFAWEVHRFSGGHARAFAVPVVLATVLLALRGRDRAAAAVPPVGALLYPPAALTALGILGFSSLRVGRWPPFEWRRLLLVGISAILVLGGALALPRMIGTAERLPGAETTRISLETSPELGPEGQRPFRSPSRKQFLKQNRSGFFLQRSGSVIAVAAALLLLARPRKNLRLLPREMLAIPLASLALFGLAHLVVPRLYWPHRYTYALLPFGCILIGATLRPTFDALAGRLRSRWIPAAVGTMIALAVIPLALLFFPLGPEWGIPRLKRFLADAWPPLAAAGAIIAVGLAAALLRRGGRLPGGLMAASLAGAILVGSVATTGGLTVEVSQCPNPPLLRFLSTLPKQTVVAGDPFDVRCIPIAARRSVVMSNKLYRIRDREQMMHMVEAYYGDSRDAILALRRRYSADYLVVNRGLLTRSGYPRRWWRKEPFTSRLEELRSEVGSPAALELPARCRTFEGAGSEVYDLTCVAETTPG